LGIGYVLAESLRPGSRIEELPLTLKKVERYEVQNATSDQPPLWTGIEFEFPELEAERVADALAAVLDERGWYADLQANGETFIVFAGRVFHYPTGDKGASSEARDYGLSVGVPAAQLDWD